MYDCESYVPTGDVIAKLQTWGNDGTETLYLDYRREPEEPKLIRQILEKHVFR